MRWFLLLLALVPFGANAVPDEILASYLIRHELCVKDARIRADSKQEYYDLKEKCKNEYLLNVEGQENSQKDISKLSPEAKEWYKFIEQLDSLPRFQLSSTRVYFNVKYKASLNDFYFKRGDTGRLILFNNGMQVEYTAIPIKPALHNARYEQGKIIISGLDSDMYYYAIRNGRSYNFETEYGSNLSANAALFLADSAAIMYNDIPIGILTRKIAKEI